MCNICRRLWTDDRLGSCLIQIYFRLYKLAVTLRTHLRAFYFRLVKYSCVAVPINCDELSHPRPKTLVPPKLSPVCPRLPSSHPTSLLCMCASLSLVSSLSQTTFLFPVDTCSLRYLLPSTLSLYTSISLRWFPPSPSSQLSHHLPSVFSYLVSYGLTAGSSVLQC